MADFEMDLPDEIMEEVMFLDNNIESIAKKMTREGAKVVKFLVLSNLPNGIAKSPMVKNLKITKTYKTPSDGGINTRVAFYGYFENEEGKTVPAPLVANVFEYGRSNLPFPKQPFMRRSFDQGQITEAMLKVQERESKGILKE